MWLFCLFKPLSSTKRKARFSSFESIFYSLQFQPFLSLHHLSWFPISIIRDGCGDYQYRLFFREWFGSWLFFQRGEKHLVTWFSRFLYFRTVCQEERLSVAARSFSTIFLRLFWEFIVGGGCWCGWRDWQHFSNCHLCRYHIWWIILQNYLTLTSTAAGIQSDRVFFGISTLCCDTFHCVLLWATWKPICWKYHSKRCRFLCKVLPSIFKAKAWVIHWKWLAACGWSWCASVLPCCWLWKWRILVELLALGAQVCFQCE